jgi:hypothetical protein
LQNFDFEEGREKGGKEEGSKGGTGKAEESLPFILLFLFSSLSPFLHFSIPPLFPVSLL